MDFSLDPESVIGAVSVLGAWGLRELQRRVRDSVLEQQRKDEQQRAEAERSRQPDPSIKLMAEAITAQIKLLAEAITGMQIAVALGMKEAVTQLGSMSLETRGLAELLRGQDKYLEVIQLLLSEISGKVGGTAPVRRVERGGGGA